MYTFAEIEALPQAEKDALYSQAKRAALKNILTFVAIKVSLYLAIAYFAKKAREL